jgi:filamentous hemagglutinin family protein
MLAASLSAWAGPEGAKVERGNVTITQRGNRTIIRASDRSIINYRSFDVGRNERVRFIQPGRDATVLNRINSTRPTQIDGSIKANGQIYFVNPNGIYFSGTSMIDAAGIYAAAGNISSQDFAAGNARFTGIQGDVVNAGRIEAGTTALVGRHVANSGVIVSDQPGGVVAMVSGDEVTLTPRGSTMGVRVARDPSGGASAVGTGVDNSGQIQARDGQALMVAGDIYALAIKNTGKVKAREIRLDSRGRGAVEVGGTLDASDRSAGGRGGEVTITGRRIGLSDATIDASGSRGGGDVRIGGDFRGGGELRRAEQVSVDEGSRINADAVRNGDGGTVAVWSDDQTRMAGSISARGGELGGHGGMIETSGKLSLDFAGARVDASGSQAPGEWKAG